ncbi:hypothetical protein MSI_17850 [Treponema sp. JC4]|nr:hypothetical protein MSI_17850 [Treponema sp. JC4]
MASILIKDTTREQRELNMEANCGFEVAHTRCARLHE